MNYRHAFHAGNFADCFKHALFLLLLRALRRKDKPFLVLDTHAGTGRYDLAGEAAQKTGEWQSGIARVLAARPPVLADFLEMIGRLGLYPGSPAIAADLLREGDRLIACELHPQDAATLKRNIAHLPGVAVHQRDGFEALKAFLPPPERRGLILIDPPFESPLEFSAIARALALAGKKFRSGVYAIWYPLKHRAPAREFLEALKLGGWADAVAAEFWLRPPLDPARLNGCGMVVLNPPYGFEDEAAPVLAALVEILGEAGAGCGLERFPHA